MAAIASNTNKTFLGNIKVRTKILGGSGVILAALAVVGGLSFFAFSNVADDFDEYSGAAKLGKVSKELAGDFATLDGEANEFLLTEDAALLAKADDQSKEMLGNITEAKTLARSEDEAKDISEIGDKIAAFQSELPRHRPR